ncbi:glycoside hydrolase family 75 protein [Streptomyces sp. NBC_00878]|uniref:glycoside hydrolase family 75 protein n=1 Tax=Streptomyces sp. NBC_00878 TaxID=2975854 RepID=UPI00225824C0|nr:glycoside hydrolase family 75 protein [Streptomyces sp. NBC_00878]MCX4911102.1 glycoside hydrolase family 75 protein [Streptomyces sp. NBC_00878]
MHAQSRSLTLAAAGAALLTSTTIAAVAPWPGAVHERAGNEGNAGRAGNAGPQGNPGREGNAGPEGDPGHDGRSVRAADLLAVVRDCVPVSRGFFRRDDGAPADIPVCGKYGAVFWKADMDIDCDGRPGRYCNQTTDPFFSDTTSYRQSDGRYLSAETLPYIVVPAASDIWNHHAHSVRRGTVAAVIHGDRVQYAVVGDVGPGDVIGEASYATARGLGIRPDPSGGGAAFGVTYILFENSSASPIENPRAAVAVGERLAREFVRRNRAIAAHEDARLTPSDHTFR